MQKFIIKIPQKDEKIDILEFNLGILIIHTYLEFLFHLV